MPPLPHDWIASMMAEPRSVWSLVSCSTFWASPVMPVPCASRPTASMQAFGPRPSLTSFSLSNTSSSS